MGNAEADFIASVAVQGDVPRADDCNFYTVEKVQDHSSQQGRGPAKIAKACSIVLDKFKIFHWGSNGYHRQSLEEIATVPFH